MNSLDLQLQTSPGTRRRSRLPSGARRLRTGGLGLVLALLWGGGAGMAAGGTTESPAQILAVEGTNWWVLPAGARQWIPAAPRLPHPLWAGDQVRTGQRTRLLLDNRRRGLIRIPEESQIEIEAESTGESVWLRIWKGMGYFFHRGEPTDVKINAESASAAIHGTEFVAELSEGVLIIHLIDGEVELSNDQGEVMLKAGERGQAGPGGRPYATGSVEAASVLQWCLYYPAVLDPAELNLGQMERQALAASLAAYEEGDLLQALALYPAQRVPASNSERVYLGALLLAVGQVDETLELLDGLDRSGGAGELAGALSVLIASIQGQDRGHLPPPGTGGSSAAMAESYRWQAEGRLTEALGAARRSVELSPGFGLGWIRVAQLEFSFGRQRAARTALETGLSHAPRHAPGMVLNGFLHAKANRVAAAVGEFDRAIELAPGIGDAWLGRGLCHLRAGDYQAGLAALEAAATVEPRRSVFRSYLGKAFAQVGDGKRAETEFELGKGLSPEDPTPWLHEALLMQRDNRINEAVGGLERSKALNDNRQLFRSRHLLDQDMAVRGANLAGIYRDAGLEQVSVREAADAVNANYANFSGHLFLADSFQELRDPNQVNLRYETAWLTEFLTAQLLAPVGSGALSQTVSREEYSRLFEQDRLGLVSVTGYGSNGDWNQTATQYGRYGGMAYAVDVSYRRDRGQRMNNDLEEFGVFLRLKQELTAQDSVFLQASYLNAEGGNLAQVFDPSAPSSGRFEEIQEPLLLAGYHRAWAPNSHTLLLAGRLHDRLKVANPAQDMLIVFKNGAGTVQATELTGIERDYRSELEVYSVEVQQILEASPHTIVVGGRFQTGDFDTADFLENLADETPSLPNPITTNVVADLQRAGVYGYYQLKVTEGLRLTAGVSYDHLRYPLNHRSAPVLPGEESTERLSPKAGVTWSPVLGTAFRGYYSRSLGGVSLDQSVRLEPSQVAGFNQAWRSLIPESVGGALAAAEFDTFGVGWEQRFSTRTYLTLAGEVLRSHGEQETGVLDLVTGSVPSSTRQELDYEERTVGLTLNQLLGDHWSAGATYRLSQAELDQTYPALPSAVPHFFWNGPRQELKATLSQLNLFGLFYHPCGAFARVNSLWSVQENEAPLPDEDFWQFNASLGFRFPGRRAEVQMGVLNITDQDYRLSPLNLTSELPRDRTFFAQVRFSF